MLTEKEKQELRALAGSQAIRDEFRLLRKNSRAAEPVSVDVFIRFLTAMARLTTKSAVPRRFVPYKSVKI
jgi:hypothetical protein